MELWIRSQDNHLINSPSNDLYYEQVVKCEPFNDIHGQKFIYTNDYIIKNNDKYLGTYKGEERALEVLKEIEEFMINTINGAINQSNIVLNCIIFNMPKE